MFFRLERDTGARHATELGTAELGDQNVEPVILYLRVRIVFVLVVAFNFYVLTLFYTF